MTTTDEAREIADGLDYYEGDEICLSGGEVAEAVQTIRDLCDEVERLQNLAEEYNQQILDLQTVEAKLRARLERSQQINHDRWDSVQDAITVRERYREQRNALRDAARIFAAAVDQSVAVPHRHNLLSIIQKTEAPE